MPDVRLPTPPKQPKPPPPPPRGSDEWKGPGCMGLILSVLVLIASAIDLVVR